jgi:hypothetical protein
MRVGRKGSRRTAESVSNSRSLPAGKTNRANSAGRTLASRERGLTSARGRGRDSKQPKNVVHMEDLAGVDAGKYTYEEMVEKLDKLRQRWR